MLAFSAPSKGWATRCTVLGFTSNLAAVLRTLMPPARAALIRSASLSAIYSEGYDQGAIGARIGVVVGVQELSVDQLRGASPCYRDRTRVKHGDQFQDHCGRPDQADRDHDDDNCRHPLAHFAPPVAYQQWRVSQ